MDYYSCQYLQNPNPNPDYALNMDNLLSPSSLSDNFVLSDYLMLDDDVHVDLHHHHHSQQCLSSQQSTESSDKATSDAATSNDFSMQVLSFINLLVINLIYS